MQETHGDYPRKVERQKQIILSYILEFCTVCVERCNSGGDGGGDSHERGKVKSAHDY